MLRRILECSHRDEDFAPTCKCVSAMQYIDVVDAKNVAGKPSEPVDGIQFRQPDGVSSRCLESRRND